MAIVAKRASGDNRCRHWRFMHMPSRSEPANVNSGSGSVGQWSSSQNLQSDVGTRPLSYSTCLSPKQLVGLGMRGNSNRLYWASLPVREPSAWSKQSSLAFFWSIAPGSCGGDLLCRRSLAQCCGSGPVAMLLRWAPGHISKPRLLIPVSPDLRRNSNQHEFIMPCHLRPLCRVSKKFDTWRRRWLDNFGPGLIY